MPPYKPLQLHISSTDSLNSVNNHHVVESVVYRLVPPSDDPNERGWLVNFVEGQWGYSHKLRLKVHSLFNFQVFELAKKYTLKFTGFPISILCKVALSFDPNFPAIMLMGKFGLYYCKLGVNTENGISLSEYLNCSHDVPYVEFEDITFYQGKFYIVCSTGTTLVVDSRLKVVTIAPPEASWSLWFSIQKKYLVESFGELLLVDRREHCIQKKLIFKVFWLNANENRWIEIEDGALSDRILIVRDQICYSIAVGEFPGCRGNAIYFCDYVLKLAIFTHVRVFRLDSGSVLPLSHCPSSDNIFCPPPKFQ